MIDAYNQRQKQTIINNYNLASMVATFTSDAFGGHELPSLYDLYPDLESSTERDVEQNKAYMNFYKDQFMAYAEKYNAQRKEN